MCYHDSKIVVANKGYELFYIITSTYKINDEPINDQHYTQFSKLSTSRALPKFPSWNPTLIRNSRIGLSALIPEDYVVSDHVKTSWKIRVRT